MRRKWEEYLTLKDIEAIKAETDKIESIVPQINFGGSDWNVKYRTASKDDGRIVSTSADYMFSENWRLAKGRFLNALDLIHKTKVAVLGSEVAADLFGSDADPLEKEVKIGGIRYTVVGVMEDKQFFDNDYNRRAMIPITTAQMRITGEDHVNFISVKAKRPEDVEDVADAMRRVYKRRHEHGDEFNIRTGLEELAEINKVLLIMKAVAGGIAGISLLVGGIGIMNIML
ncbi:ABC transporter permease, partial [Endozoicomonas atrinae]|uniref:ABC transporter permease n=1 Tax=Endozoicomonas atrinae TaxID=1333660 RepID=UPI001112CA9D